jgi:hypothetical protein
MRIRSLTLLSAAALLAACADGAPLAPSADPTPSPTPSTQRFDCIAKVREGRIDCQQVGPDGARLALMGNPFVTISSSNVSFNSGTGVFQADFTVTSNLTYPIGTADGTTADPNGVRVLLHSGPTVTSGWGIITVLNADGTGTFTASNQPYFQYPGILAAGATSAAKTWQFQVDPDVAFFGFTMLVDAAVPPVLQIHEIMAHPTTASEPAGEWIEVFNGGKVSVDLQGWTLASGGDAGHVVASSVVVPPGNYVVLGGSTSTAANGGVPVSYAWTGIDLANGTSDWLSLRAPTGFTVDSVDWGAAPGDTPAAPPTGASLQIAGADSANLHLSGATSHWHPGVTPFGTAGELGTPAARNLFPLTGIVSVAAAGYTCAVDGAGQAWCWGTSNLSGQLGDGTAGTTHPPFATKVAQPGGVSFTTVSTRNTRACALSTAGKVWCWGEDVPAGPPLYELDRYTPSLLPQGALTFTQLSSNCALVATGESYCWAEGSTAADRGVVTAQYQPGLQFTQISASSSLLSKCGLTAAGQAWCSGFGSALGIGIDPAVLVDTFVAVHQPLGVTFQSISTNRGATCAVSTIGQGFCWGRNTQGDVGDGTTTPRGEPVFVDHPPSIRFTRIEVGLNNFACGLSTTGQAYCWGSGPLGNGTSSSPSPVAVSQPAGVTFTALATGAGHACGIAAGTGYVYCWGENGAGAVGDGSTTDRPTPVLVVR